MNRIVVSLAVISMFIASCKKSDDDTNATAKPVINPPTSEDYFYGVKMSTLSMASWSTDMKSHLSFTDKFKKQQAYVANICGNNIVIALRDGLKHNVVFADLSNLGSFTTISSERSLVDVAMINGMVVASVADGNNFYVGHCNTNNGDKALTFVLLPSSTSFWNFKLVGNNLICDATVAGTKVLAYSADGENWTITSDPLVQTGEYEYFDGKTWAFSNNMWSYNAGSDFSTGWETDTLGFNEGNTTDTVGTFDASGEIIVRKNDWLLYGSIYASSNGKRYPCVNISTNKGQTWTTSFLTGLPSYSNNVSWQSPIHATNSMVIIDNTHSAEFSPGIYSSSNGIDFTLWTSAADIAAYYTMQIPRVIR